MTLSLEMTNGIPGAWASAILRASWQGGAALLTVWLLCRAWAGMPPRARCWLWRLAYLKLLLALVSIAPIRLAVLRPLRSVQRVSAQRPDANEAQVRPAHSEEIHLAHS